VKEPCVYILSDRYRGAIYFGVTSALVARVHQHREGTFEGFSKRYGLKRLVWFEACSTMEEAIAREKQLKRWHRDWKINLIEATNEEWRDLAIDLGFDPLP